MASTLEWLRSRDDDALVGLLRARPDLAVPAPPDLTVLAGRINTGPSVWRAMEGLNRFHIEVLQGLTLLGAERRGATRKELATILGPDVSEGDWSAAIDELQTLGLVRGKGRLHMPSSVTAALGPYLGGLGAPGQLTDEQARAALAALSEPDRGLLFQLTEGTFRGNVGGATGPVTEAIGRMTQAGLLTQVDASTVELPREVGLALRGERPMGQIQVHQPVGEPTDQGVATVDGTGAGQALATLDRLRRVLDIMGATPAPVLKAGGLGIRELRRLAKSLGVEQWQAALDLELLVATNMLSTESAAPWDVPQAWAPTPLADEILALPEEQSWTQLAQAWLEMRRDPARVGSRDAAGKVINALSGEVGWYRGPSERRFVFAELDALPAGVGLGTSDLSGRLAWRSPLRPPEHREHVLTATIREATQLGVVAFDALTSAGRALLAGELDRATVALKAALPEPVDSVMVQADLTVVAPGRLVPALAARLAQVADIESKGTATVYRVTAGSIRRAMDAGVASSDLHELFARHSATGVPQALTYLIDDIGRRYGVLRAGSADAYLRSDDPHLIDQAISSVAGKGVTARRLAPTVAVTDASLNELIDLLRSAGLVPAAEDLSGAIIDLRPPPKRVKANTEPEYHWREPPPPDSDQLHSLVARMRSADRAVAANRKHAPRQTTLETVAMLRDALEDRDAVWIRYVDGDGSATQRMIEPISMSGGSVVAYDTLRRAIRTFSLHRISDVRPSDDTRPVDGEPMDTTPGADAPVGAAPPAGAVDGQLTLDEGGPDA